jgi:hypothetical protein
MADLAVNIYYWALGNDARIEQLQQWYNDALMAIVASGGQQVVQSTANNVSVTFSAGMTLQAWFDTLTRTLAMLQSGQLPTKHKQVFLPAPETNNQ